MDIKALYDSSAIMYVLGVLLKRPDFALYDEHNLSVDDFDGFKRIIFGAIKNIAEESSTESLTPFGIDVYIKSSPQAYEEYRKNLGYEWLVAVSNQYYDENQFQFYLERVKKFTLLRELHNSGFEIKDLYNTDLSLEKQDAQMQRLDETSLSEMIEVVQKKITEIEDKYLGKGSERGSTIDEGIRELVESFKDEPEVGPALNGIILNSISRGARKGKMYLYSAPSGHGKTRFFVGQACSLSMPYIDDDMNVLLPADPEKTLFITTEMEKDEIQTLVLAYITNIDEEKIITGMFTFEERERIKMGLQLMEMYGENLIVERIPDPTIGAVRSRIKKYITSHKVSSIFYDYIFTSPGLSGEFSRAFLREDVILMMFANTLKEIAASEGVFVYTGTQVNRGWESRVFRNENSLAGSKAIADKTDFGAIAIQLRGTDEIDRVKPIVEEGKFKEPNLVLDIYKNRRGRVAKSKIYRYFNYGTCRAEDLFMTDPSGHRVEKYDAFIEDGAFKAVDFTSLLEMRVDNVANKKI